MSDYAWGLGVLAACLTPLAVILLARRHNQRRRARQELLASEGRMYGELRKMGLDIDANQTDHPRPKRKP